MPIQQLCSPKTWLALKRELLASKQRQSLSRLLKSSILGYMKQQCYERANKGIVLVSADVSFNQGVERVINGGLMAQPSVATSFESKRAMFSKKEFSTERMRYLLYETNDILTQELGTLLVNTTVQSNSFPKKNTVY